MYKKRVNLLQGIFSAIQRYEIDITKPRTYCKEFFIHYCKQDHFVH